MSDEGFHEIQLNGKQLVFLFMAATVVSVVIFLCGVMVGRGVQTARATGGDAVQSQPDVRPVEPARGEAAPSGEAPQADPVPVEDDYYDRLVEGSPSESLSQSPAARRSESTKPAAGAEPAAVPPRASVDTPAANPRAVVPPPTAKPKPETSAPVAATASGGGAGFAVQLAALRERNEADAIAKQLVAKGYQAYVLVPAPGAPPVYRVQVGRFGSRSEADRVAARLRREERFKPWVTR